MANISTTTAASITLGVAVGPRQFIADQLLGKADVIRAMQTRRRNLPSSEESLGVSRINHILRVHNPSGTAGCRNLRWAAVSRTAPRVSQRTVRRKRHSAKARIGY